MAKIHSKERVIEYAVDFKIKVVELNRKLDADAIQIAEILGLRRVMFYLGYKLGCYAYVGKFMEEWISLLVLGVAIFGRSILGFFIEFIYGVLFKVFFPIIKVVSRGFRRWDRLDELGEYLRNNPQCRTDQGIKCNACGSKSIRNWGLRHENDKFRIFICNHCDTDLYKK